MIRKFIEIYYSMYHHYEGEGYTGTWFAIAITMYSHIIILSSLISNVIGIILISKYYIISSGIISLGASALILIIGRPWSVRHTGVVSRIAAILYSVLSLILSVYMLTPV